MKMLVYVLLFLALATLVIGMVIGIAFKIIGLAVGALLVVAGVSWVLRRLGRPTDIDRKSIARERLTR